MNFLDTYGLTGTGTNTPPADVHPEQSLNEEVSQVIGQLGKFWGGFRKQARSHEHVQRVPQPQLTQNI
jgi:truncated hemoglobin YjbI